MKRAVIILSVFVLFTQCTENESENVILPRIISASAALLSDYPYRRVEYIGKFNDGQDPVKDIKIAWSTNVTIDMDPRFFSMSESAQFLDSHTFKIVLETGPFGSDYIAFYFISENTATYSEIYSLSVVDNKPVFEQFSREKR